MDVGFIGLGKMGTAMARNIAKAGHHVRAWNRSDTGDNIDGLEIVSSPSDAFQSDIVFTVLSDDAAIREVLLSSNALHGTRAGVVHVVTSTISVDFADELRAKHVEVGIGYVAAPVFGRPDVAEAAQLNIMVAGEKGAVDKVRPLLDVVGRKIWVLGEDPKQANAAKIAGNMMIAMAIEAMAEAVVLTESNGLAAEHFFDLILQTLFAGRAYENYSTKIVKRDFEAGFRMQLGLKDLGLAAAAAEKSGKRLPLLDAVRARMAEAVEAGMGDKDWSAMAGYTLQQRGSASV
jgi:3-hydroxyisobutyrate dehydrogenase-like beta-hydroxyacid dehydrogenase